METLQPPHPPPPPTTSPPSPPAATQAPTATETAPAVTEPDSTSSKGKGPTPPPPLSPDAITFFPHGSPGRSKAMRWSEDSDFSDNYSDTDSAPPQRRSYRDAVRRGSPTQGDMEAGNSSSGTPVPSRSSRRRPRKGRGHVALPGARGESAVGSLDTRRLVKCRLWRTRAWWHHTVRGSSGSAQSISSLTSASASELLPAAVYTSASTSEFRSASGCRRISAYASGFREKPSSYLIS